MRVCPTCGVDLSPAADICVYCGRYLPPEVK